MALASGMSAQLGWKAETIYGTAVTVDRFIPLLGQDFDDDYARSDAEDIIAGAQTIKQEQIRIGNKTFSGTVEAYLLNRNVAELFYHTLGGKATVGSGPYTHTITPADPTGRALTMQVGTPDLGGTVRPFTYEGVKIQTLGINVEQGEYVKVKLDVLAEDVATGTALATASYPASLTRYHSNDFSCTLGGVSLCVRSFEIEFNNNLDDTRRCSGSQVTKEPIRNGYLEITGSMEIEWTDLVPYNRVSGLTYADLVVAFTKSPDSITITCDVDSIKASQPVAGRGVVYQTIDFRGAGASTDADTVSVVVINADSVA